jgi:hypothetical protein
MSAMPVRRAEDLAKSRDSINSEEQVTVLEVGPWTRGHVTQREDTPGHLGHSTPGVLGARERYIQTWG